MNDKLPRMDYRQHRRARRLVHECCNYDGGNCLLLDDGAPLPELMDRKKRDIMERKGDKEDENKRQKQQKESSAAAL